MPKTALERQIDSGSVLRGGGGGRPGGGVGITDHGQLSGLGDDDHAQYHNDTRGDLRYYTKTLEDAWRAAHIALPDVHHARATAVAPLTVTGQQLALTISEALEIVSNALKVKRHTDSGLTVVANGLALGAPLAATVSSANAVNGTQHSHAVDSSADPNATANLLATTATGLLTLRNLAMRQAAQSYATFASGFAGSGWRVDYGITTVNRASAEFDDLIVRGKARFYELLIQQIRATNGSLFVTSGSKVVMVTATDNNWTVNGSALTFNGEPAVFNANFYTINTAAAGDADRSLYHGFLYGDLPVAQQMQWDGAQFTGVMQSKIEVTRVDSLTQYGAALVEGDAPATGYDYIRRGNTVDPSRRGAIYLTSDDAAAPFIDIIDGLQYHSDWGSALLKRTRLGKLTGISDTDFGGPLEGYGLYSQNVYLKGKIVVTGGNAATIGYVDDGLSVKADTLYVDAVAALKANLTYVDSELADAVAPLANITYVDDRVTHIDGGSITTGTINANRISAVNLAVLQAAVANLSALNANLGTVTAGSVVIGSANKLWLNDAGDGTLRIGGATKSAAPFQVSAAGHLDAVDASFGTLQIDSSGAYVSPVSSAFNTSYGYKFKYGSVAAGLFAGYAGGSQARLWLLNNKPDSASGIVDAAADSAITVSGAAGSAKSSTLDLRAERIVSGAAKFTGLSLLNTPSARKATLHADTLVIAPEAGGEYTIWHSNNDGPGSGLNADTVDGKEAADFAWINGSNTFAYETTFSAAVNFGNYIRLSLLSSAPAYQSGYALIYLLNGGSNAYQLRAKIRSLDGTKFVDYQITTT